MHQLKSALSAAEDSEKDLETRLSTAQTEVKARTGEISALKYEIGQMKVCVCVCCGCVCVVFVCFVCFVFVKRT